MSIRPFSIRPFSIRPRPMMPLWLFWAFIGHGLFLICSATLQWYGRPRMTEELKELGLRVGQPLPGNGLHANRERGRVGRVRQENDPPDRFQNLSHCARTAFKLFERGSSSERPTATTSSTSRRICCSRTSLRAGQIRNALSWFASKPFPGNRRVTSPMFGLGKAGCILL